MKKKKPIHKYNNGNGATLCNKCSIVITTGLTQDLYCESCKDKVLGKSKEELPQWWGYLHQNGTPQVKRYIGEVTELSIDDAYQSPFVLKVIEPFEAEDREGALNILKEKLKDE